jgi:hypothetical protein
MEAQLQQLIELQTEQNELLKRHLLRLRFSLAALLLLTTVCCLTLGYVTYQIRDAGRPIPTIQYRQRISPRPGIYPGGPQVPINQSPPVSRTLRPGLTLPIAHS